MADYDTSPAPVEHHINWGGVLKGAAIVAGIAVAAVVGFWLLSSASALVTGYIATHAGVSALAAGAHTTALYTAHGAGWAVGSIGHLLGGIPAGLAHILGLTGQHFAQAAAVNHVVGLAGAAAATGLAVHAAAPTLMHGHYMDVDPSAHNADTGVMTTTVPMHDITHITHHAAAQTDEERHHARPVVWTQKFAPQVQVNNFASSARAPKPAANFTEQLNADRANLDAALAK